jgi:Uma2 family endonuclease
MSSVASKLNRLLTIEEFARLPVDGMPRELVRGRIVPMPPLKPRHGKICFNSAHLLGIFNDEYDVGHMLSNDTGVITQRGPDTLRGADVSFYRYQKLPKGPVPTDYIDIPPDLIIEVLSEGDRWSQVLAKVAEYLEAGVTVVIVLEPNEQKAFVYRADRACETFTANERLTVPDVLPGFAVPVLAFFE